MPRTNIYINDTDHASLQAAQTAMKAAGTSLSAETLRLLKGTKFWPKKAVKPAVKPTAKKATAATTAAKKR